MTIEGRRNGAGTSVVEHVSARRQRSIHEIVAAGVDDVEEVGRQPSPATSVGLGAEVAHRVLEPSWSARLGQPGDLTIEDEIPAGQAGDERHDTRQTIGDLVEIAREQVHVTATPVRLDTCAVQLPLDRCHARLGERLGNALRRRGEHRPDSPSRDEGGRAQRVDTTGERLEGGGSEVPGEHVGAADLVDGNARPPGDGLDHHAVQGTLAQLSAEHPPQQALLDRRGPGEHRGKQVAPARRRARPRLGGEVTQPAIDAPRCRARPRRRRPRRAC